MERERLIVGHDLPRQEATNMGCKTAETRCGDARALRSEEQSSGVDGRARSGRNNRILKDERPTIRSLGYSSCSGTSRRLPDPRSNLGRLHALLGRRHTVSISRRQRVRAHPKIPGNPRLTVIGTVTYDITSTSMISLSTYHNTRL